MSRWDDRIKRFGPDRMGIPTGPLRLLFLSSIALFGVAFAIGIAQTVSGSRVLPGLSSNPSRLARAMIREGDLAGAAKELAAYEAIVPRGNESVLELAGLLSQLGRDKEAFEAYKRAAASLPNDPRAQAALGSQWFIRGKFAAAISSFERALALDPDFPSARENLAVSYLNEGRVDDAIETYRAVIDAGMDTAGTHLTLSHAYKLTGDRQKAIEHAEIALHMDSSNAEIRAQRDRLIRDAESSRP